MKALMKRFWGAIALVALVVFGCQKNVMTPDIGNSSVGVQQSKEPEVAPVGSIQFTVITSYMCMSILWKHQTSGGELGLDIYIFSVEKDSQVLFVSNAIGGIYKVDGLSSGVYIVGTTMVFKGMRGDPGRPVYVYVPDKFDQVAAKK